MLVNVFSHPLANYLVWIVGELRSTPIQPPEILLLEAGIVIVEWLLLCYALPRRRKLGLFGLSLAMNGVSYLAGVIVLL